MASADASVSFSANPRTLPALPSIRSQSVKPFSVAAVRASSSSFSVVSNCPSLRQVVHCTSSFLSPCPPPAQTFSLISVCCQRLRASVLTNASKRSNVSAASDHLKDGENKQAEEDEDEEVELSWVEEKVEDLVHYTSSVVRSVPGPRVGNGELPWLLAVPIGYVTISFLIAVVKTVRKYNAPKGKRLRQIGKNAWLLTSLSEYLPAKRLELDSGKLKQLAKKCQFDMAEVLRKYIRYALNERPFDTELVADLIHLRKVSLLDDKTVAEILNEVSRRIVKAKGPVIVDTTGFTEKGLKRKVAVQALFSKILYLSELDEFCSTTDQTSLSIKEIFGVTEKFYEGLEGLEKMLIVRLSVYYAYIFARVSIGDFSCDDVNLIRIETLSGATEAESLENLVGSSLNDDLDDEER